MDIFDLHVGGFKDGSFATGQFHIHKDDKTHVIATLHDDICVMCKKSTMSEERWIDVINHEITELTAVEIAVNDGFKWNPSGYNKAITFAIPQKHYSHVCNNGKHVRCVIYG